MELIGALALMGIPPDSARRLPGEVAFTLRDVGAAGRDDVRAYLAACKGADDRPLSADMSLDDLRRSLRREA